MLTFFVCLKIIDDGSLPIIRIWFTLLTRSGIGSCVSILVEIYTQKNVKEQHIFFGDTVFGGAERNMWVLEIKYFEFYWKFYYFYEHLELQIILWTKYLDY